MVNLWREKRVHSLLNEKQIREQSNYRGDIEVVQFSFEIYNEFTWVLPDKYETFVPLKDGLAPDVESPSIVKAGFFDFLRSLIRY